MRRLHRPGVIGRAVEIPIVEVLASLGVPVAGTPPPGTSIKIWCPFSDLHPDGGKEREMRLYDDNKVYCHVCCRQYDSVSLAAEAWECSQLLAAQRLLSGQAVQIDVKAIRSMYVVRAGAVAALGEWADAQQVDRFSPEYRRCLALIDHIEVPEQVTLWLGACKQVLGRTGCEY